MFPEHSIKFSSGFHLNKSGYILLKSLIVVIITSQLLLSVVGSVVAESDMRFGQGKVGTFIPTPCPFEKPAWAVEGEDLDCGTVVVPKNHSQPEGPVIELAVVIIRPSSENPKSDPFFMAQGGPGGSTIDTYALRLLNDRSFLPDRDIVLFDQRGTGYSNPSLYCSEIDELTANTIEKNLTLAEENQLTQEALQACRHRLSEDEKIDLSAFNSLENAADIDLIRTALGYDQINFYGVSYGTLLGLHYMSAFPGSLRSVVLDGVVPPQTNFLLNSAQTMGAAFDRLFAACEADIDCNQHYPDLESVFFDTVDRLNQDPAQISVKDPETNRIFSAAVVNGDTFMNLTFQFLYAGSLIPAMPRMIFDVSQGEFGFFARIYELIVFDRSISLGMYYSVICSEDADFSKDDFKLDGLPPEIASLEKDTPVQLLQTCSLWDVEPLGAEIDLPVKSQIPTLLLSGYFDPITPPSYAAAAAETLTLSQQVVFSTGAHGQALEGSCPNAIIYDFVNHPKEKVDTSCSTAQAAPAFITPENTIDLPSAIMLLNGDPQALKELLIFGLSLLFLMSAVFIIPMIAVIVYIRNRRSARRAEMPFSGEYSASQLQDSLDFASPLNEDKKPSFYSGIAGWLTVISGLILLLFAFLFGTALIDLALKNDVRLWFGVPDSMTNLLILPLVFAVISVLIVWLCLISWIRGYWSTWTRIYYTLLSCSALVCTLALYSWGILTALIR